VPKKLEISEGVVITFLLEARKFTLKTAGKGGQNGAVAQKPKRFLADALFSTPQLSFFGVTLLQKEKLYGCASRSLELEKKTGSGW
jgi:hypothetical protein